MSEKLISADRVLSSIKRDSDLLASCGEEQTADDVIAIIKTAPAVDAVEVVRCEKCKHYLRPEYEDSGYCMHDNGLCGFVKDDYYCPYGERRDENAID